MPPLPGVARLKACPGCVVEGKKFLSSCLAMALQGGLFCSSLYSVIEVDSENYLPLRSKMEVFLSNVVKEIILKFTVAKDCISFTQRYQGVKFSYKVIRS